MDRRKFLQLAGTFAVNAAAGGVLSSCHNDSGSYNNSVGFPQGVASGDPGPNSVVLWTRAEPIYKENVSVTCEVSTTPDFSRLVSNEVFQVGHSSDYTLRVLVENLQPDTYYYYRFMASGTISMAGRTRTAPELNQQVPTKFAFVSCQERHHGFYNAYQRMILDDEQKPLEEQVRFILHLGDFIYETRNELFQQPVDDFNNPRDSLYTHAGEKREIPPFPHGGVTSGGIEYAKTLEDYRHLYKHYLRDPQLQAARARWPFVCIWDDHEFSDDCWQTEANYNDRGNTSGFDEPSQQRKVAANQAWFEFTPVNYTKSETLDEDLVHTKSFEFVAVENTPNDSVDENNLSDNQNNIAAIASMTIYRSLRFGQYMNLVLTDNRSYRSDHAVPEWISSSSPYFLESRVATPLNILNQLDAGKTANNYSPNSHIFVGEVIPNPRLDSPAGTILGQVQKHWWKETLSRSNTAWNIWGNSVPLMRLLLNLNAADRSLPDAVLSADTWDGYPSERKELMTYLLNNGINNVVSLSGDLHSHIAGVVMQDYELFHNTETNQQAIPVVAEVVCAGISSRSQFSVVEAFTRIDNPSELEQTLRNLITYDARQTTEPTDNYMVNNLNNTLLNGVRSGLIASITNSTADIENYRDPVVNGHIKYVDTAANGYGLAHVAESEITVQLVTISDVNSDPTDSIPQLKNISEFKIAKTPGDSRMNLAGPIVQGTPPFPF